MSVQQIQSSKIGLRETLINAQVIFWRNLLIFKRGVLYFFSSIVFETLVYFYAFAMVLAQLINSAEFSYTQFFIPSIVALIGVQTAFIESSWNSLKRFGSRKSLITYLSTQLRVDDIYAGELIWSITKSFMASFVSIAVLSILNVYNFNQFFLTLLVVALNCWCFSALSLLLLSFSKSAMTFTKHHIFVMLPIIVFSNVFFPFGLMPSFMQGISYISPLTHVTECLRLIQAGSVDQFFGVHLGVLFFTALFLTYMSYSLIKKRIGVEIYRDSSSLSM